MIIKVDGHNDIYVYIDDERRAIDYKNVVKPYGDHDYQLCSIETLSQTQRAAFIKTVTRLAPKVAKTQKQKHPIIEDENEM